MKLLRPLVLVAGALLALHGASAMLAPLTAPILALVVLIGLYVLVFHGPSGFK